MIKILKRQLSDPQSILAALLLFPLAGFFIYAAKFETTFFFIIGITLLLSVILLGSLRFHMIRRKAEISVQEQDYLEKVNLLEADIDKMSRSIESFRKKIVGYSQLKDITEHLSTSFTLKDTSDTLCTEVNKIYGHEDLTVILYLFHSRTGELGLSSSQKGQMEVNIKAKKGDIYDQWVVKTMKPLVVEDARSDFRFDVEKIATEESRPIASLISVPLMIGSKAIGILRVDSPKEHYFEQDDVRLLSTIGDLGAMAIENAQLYERIEEMAIRDSLTNLFLRRYLLDRMAHEIRRELRRQDELSFLMIDLDKFKQYNDTYGHTAGDIVLRAVATILFDMFNRPGDIVCRYGGEEFAVMLPDCSKEKAIDLAERVRKKIEAQTIVLRREKTRITVSIGVAAFPRDAQLKEELIQKADAALYRAKEDGRNQVVA